jgi:hypothetical protein
VGAYDSESSAKITFTPGTSLPLNGAIIEFKMPVWYGGTSTQMYSFEEANFECLCSRITAGLQQYTDSGWDLSTGKQTKTYIIEYTKLSGATIDPLEFNCNYFRNPIVPLLTSGYQIITKDLDGHLIDVSSDFSLDASGYSPFVLPTSAVTYSISGSTTVQEKAALTVSFESSVPFEYDGCYVKYEFPREIEAVSADLRTYTGDGLMLSSSGGTSRTPEYTDLVSDPKYLIMKGCLKNVDNSFIEYTMQMKFSDIYLPYAVRTTSAFDIYVYKNFDASTKTLSNQILRIQDSYIKSTLFETNDLTGLTITATNYAV